MAQAKRRCLHPVAGKPLRRPSGGGRFPPPGPGPALDHQHLGQAERAFDLPAVPLVGEQAHDPDDHQHVGQVLTPHGMPAVLLINEVGGGAPGGRGPSRSREIARSTAGTRTRSATGRRPGAEQTSR